MYLSYSSVGMVVMNIDKEMKEKLLLYNILIILVKDHEERHVGYPPVLGEMLDQLIELKGITGKNLMVVRDAANDICNPPIV